jgi:hypothetical protein
MDDGLRYAALGELACRGWLCFVYPVEVAMCYTVMERYHCRTMIGPSNPIIPLEYTDNTLYYTLESEVMFVMAGVVVMIGGSILLFLSGAMVADLMIKALHRH